MSQAGRRGRGRARPVRTPVVRFGAAGLALSLVPFVPGGALGRDEAGSRPQHAVTTPVDQIRARQWHLDAMRIPRAWRVSKGAGVTVAVLDTGVDRRHPDLVGRVATGPDLTGGTRRPGGGYWGLHGTSMASIIAGHGNGPGQQRGVLGVAPSSRILSIRVTWENDDPQRQNGGQGNRNRDAVAQGIRYAVDHGAGIINMSLGGGRLFYDGNSTEESAIRYALDRGVVLIASAGNDGAGPNRNNFPAAYRGVIAVGALDRRLRFWKDSNRRPYVAVCAPGVEIVSADSGSGYVIGTGTSPSSAIVAGVAALIRARYPKLGPEDVREALVRGAVPDRPTGSSTCTGPLDAARALTAAGKINRTAGGSEDQPRSPSPAPVDHEEDSGSGSGLLVAAILGGGGLVIGLIVLLTWRRRPRPEYEPDDFDELEDYGLGARRMPPRSLRAVAAHDSRGEMYAAPANAPLWQNNEVYAGPPLTPPAPTYDRPGRHAAPPGVVPDFERPGASEEDRNAGANLPPIPSELHPFLPGAAGPGDEARRPNGLPDGDDGYLKDDPLGLGRSYIESQRTRTDGESSVMNDAEWDRFRRNALGGTSVPQGEEALVYPPALPGVFAPPVRPMDDLPTDALPAAPPTGAANGQPTDRTVPLDDDWRGLPRRRRRPAEDDDSLPPWW